jgi:ATP-dependent protease ClpP protease subunit
MSNQKKPAAPPLLDPLTMTGYIMLDKEFDEKNISPIIKTIKLLNILPKKPERILLDINSPGGKLWSLTHLLQTMKESKIPVDTHTSGLAASCGCLLLMAGRNRTATRSADIMSHQYSWNAHGKEHELYGRQKAFKNGSKRMIAMYKEFTGKSEKYIRKYLLCPTDVWLTASQARKHGIIDNVK